MEEKAEGAALTVARESVVAKVESAAPKAAITGEGKVTEGGGQGGSGTKVDTAGTTLTVDKDAAGVTAGDKTVAGGETVVVEKPKEEQKPPAAGAPAPPTIPPPSPTPAASLPWRRTRTATVSWWTASLP